jgi:hypothetical protein
MVTIKQIMSWPDQTPVDAIQLRIVGAYEHRARSGANGPYTVQNADAEDAAGDKIRISVWNHPDISPMKGKMVVVHSNAGRGGKSSGVKVKHGSYEKNGQPVQTVELEVSKSGAFQFVEVYNNNNPKDKAPDVKPNDTPAQGTKAVGGAENGQYVDHRAEGQRLGMCFKLAGDFALASSKGALSQDEFIGIVKDLTPKLVQASRDLEK